MALIKTPKDIITHFNLTNECKMQVHQFYNSHKEEFLKPLIGILNGIKKQLAIISNNELEHPKGTFYLKTQSIKIIYKKVPTLEIVGIFWLK